MTPRSGRFAIDAERIEAPRAMGGYPVAARRQQNRHGNDELWSVDRRQPAGAAVATATAARAAHA